jgi:hypothetical protein
MALLIDPVALFWKLMPVQLPGPGASEAEVKTIGSVAVPSITKRPITLTIGVP